MRDNALLLRVGERQWLSQLVIYTNGCELS